MEESAVSMNWTEAGDAIKGVREYTWESYIWKFAIFIARKENQVLCVVVDGLISLS